jgi:hypothetical protein
VDRRQKPAKITASGLLTAENQWMTRQSGKNLKAKWPINALPG